MFSRCSTVLFLFFISAVSAFAQSKLTKISGKVMDAESGLPLVGATVLLSNTKTGVNTDVEGTYFLQVEKDKKYTITISSVGYQTKVVNDVLAGSDNATINIAMEKASTQLSNVVVTAGSARRESIASLYTAQKNSSAISDAISAEAIRKSPDRNTGDVLKRVSGASIQDNKFVVIRGLSERYNESLLNNAILPSTEPDKKAFSFDIIPSSLVDNITIYKTATPDLPGNFSGGAVKINTKDYPAKRLSEFSFSIGYNSLTTFQNFYKGYPEGSMDWLGFFGTSRVMPGPYARHRGAGFINLSDDFKKSTTKLFPNTFGYEAATASAPNISIAYTAGNTKLLGGNKKLGYVYALSYGTGRRVSDRLRNDYQIDRLFLYEYNTNNYDVKNNISALLNLTYAYNKSKLSLKNLFNNDFVKTVGLRNGFDSSNRPNVFYYKSLNSEAVANGIYNSVLEGMHSLNNGWSADWNGSFGVTYRWQPDQRILTFRSPENDYSNYYLRLSNQNSPEIRNAGRIYSFLTEMIYGANANMAKQFTWLGQTQKLKFGTANYYRSRNVQVDALGYASLDPYGITIPEGKGVSFNNIFSKENIEQYRLTVANIGNNSTDYTGTGLLNAGYVMLDNKFSDKVKLTWGVRAENYWQRLSSKGNKDVAQRNFDVLPSALFTYALNNKTNIRVAASQAVNRPEFRELASYSVYDYDNYFVIKGNPNLQRSKNTNADLRYEWFPKGGEIVSLSLFYKHFLHPIEQTNEGNDVLSYENADKASVYGAEVELRKKLDFIDNAFLRRLAIYTNAAYVKGSVNFDGTKVNSPLQGQSPYLINGGITYSSNKDDFSVNLLYNKIGPRLRFRAVKGGPFNIYEKPRDMMDVQVSKKFINNKLEVKLTVSDIFAQPYAWYSKFDTDPATTDFEPAKDKIITSFKYGTTATLGVKYSLGK